MHFSFVVQYNREADDEDSPGFYIDLARVFGGASLFSFPILMPMETWGLGVLFPHERIDLLMVVGYAIAWAWVPTSSGPLVAWGEMNLHANLGPVVVLGLSALIGASVSRPVI